MKKLKLSSYQAAVEILSLALVIATLMYIFMTALKFIPGQAENPNMPWDMDTRYKKNIAVETRSLLGESKLMCLALFSYMCWNVISQRPMSLVPIFVLCVLISADIIWRTIRISKYKKP